MVEFGSGTFGRSLGHEGRALMNEISALTRIDLRRVIAFSLCHVKTQQEHGHLQTRKWVYKPDSKSIGIDHGLLKK